MCQDIFHGFLYKLYLNFLPVLWTLQSKKGKHESFSCPIVNLMERTNSLILVGKRCPFSATGHKHKMSSTYLNHSALLRKLLLKIFFSKNSVFKLLNMGVNRISMAIPNFCKYLLLNSNLQSFIHNFISSMSTSWENGSLSLGKFSG